MTSTTNAFDTEVFGWVRENGPATLAEICDAFESYSTRKVANSLGRLFRAEDVQQVRNPGAGQIGILWEVNDR